MYRENSTGQHEVRYQKYVTGIDLSLHLMNRLDMRWSHIFHISKGLWPAVVKHCKNSQ